MLRLMRLICFSFISFQSLLFLFTESEDKSLSPAPLIRSPSSANVPMMAAPLQPGRGVFFFFFSICFYYLLLYLALLKLLEFRGSAFAPQPFGPHWFHC